MMDRFAFAMLSLAECARLLEKIAGREEAELVLGRVFNDVAKRVEESFGWSRGDNKPTLDETVQNLLRITHDWGASFAVRSKTEDRILLSSTQCPFGAGAIGCRSLCTWSSALWGGTLARAFGYASVSVDKSIAAGDGQCELTISLRPTGGTKNANEVEYFGEDTLTPNKVQPNLRDVKDRSRKERELLRRNRHAVALYEIGRQITSSLDIDHVLTVIAKNTLWVLECHFVGVVLDDATTKRQSYKVVVGSRRMAGAPFNPEEEDLWTRVRSTQSPVILNNEIPERPRVLGAEDLQSAVGIPLIYQQHVKGMLVVGYRYLHEFSDDEIQLLSNLGDQTAIAVENARLYQSSVEHLKALEALSAQLMAVREEERRKIARELHDGIGQTLTGIRLNLELLCREVPMAATAGLERVENIRTMIDETIAEVRQMAFELRPSVLDDLGLAAALRQYIARFNKHSDVEAVLNIQQPFLRLAPTIEATLYRVVQEALTNVARHAHATQAEVRLMQCDTGLILEISDNGSGFDVRRLQNIPDGARRNGGLGIVTMQERIAELNGQFELRSEVGNGTHIHIEIPLEWSLDTK